MIYVGQLILINTPATLGGHVDYEAF